MCLVSTRRCKQTERWDIYGPCSCLPRTTATARVMRSSTTTQCVVCQQNDFGTGSSGAPDMSNPSNSVTGGRQYRVSGTGHSIRTARSCVTTCCLLFTRLRRTDALCLRWENVNLKGGTLCAVETKNRSKHVSPMGRYPMRGASPPSRRVRQRGSSAIRLPAIESRIHIDRL